MKSPGRTMRKPRERRMLLRSRVALSTALVVAAAIAGISILSWVVTQHNLRAQLDESLTRGGVRLVGAIRHELGQAQLPPPPPMPDPSLLCRVDNANEPLQRFVEGIQLLRNDGSVCAPTGVDEVVTTAQDRRVTTPTLRDGETRSGAQVRVLLRPLEDGGVLVTSRSLATINNTLAGLRTTLIGVSVLGVAVAAASGLLLTRNALAPMERLTRTAEHIARTEDLATPVDVSGRDEVGRLGRAFTAMTAALAVSRQRQRELVTDAAHELRTPLTSLRTNVDLLVRSERTGRPLRPDQRARILSSLQSQTGEFSDLITELVQLARDERELARTEVPMADVIAKAVRRASSRAREHRFAVDAVPWCTIGDASALERSLLNLLDNAVKFSPSTSLVSVSSRPGWIIVADQGPGVPREQQAHAFDRFWRAPEARSLPGSGLGLAIVATTTAAHGGQVRFLDPPKGRGACVRVDLPVTPLCPSEPHAGPE